MDTMYMIQVSEDGGKTWRCCGFVGEPMDERVDGRVRVRRVPMCANHHRGCDYYVTVAGTTCGRCHTYEARVSS